MKRHLLFLAALLIVNLAASAQKKFSVYAVGFTIRRISSIPVTMRERKITSICPTRAGTA